MSNIYADDEYHGSLDLFAEKAMCIVQPHTKLRDLGALSYAGYWSTMNVEPPGS